MHVFHPLQLRSSGGADLRGVSALSGDRFLAMRAVFHTYAEHMGGIILVGAKRIAT